MLSISDNSFDNSYKTFPIFVGLTITLNTFFIIYKGGKGIGLDDLSASGSLLIATLAGIVTGSGIIPLIPRMKESANRKFQNNGVEINEETLECLNETERFSKKKNKFQQCITSIKENI